MEDVKHDISESCEGQLNYCIEHDYPLFAPNNGCCYRCGKNIYGNDGICTKYASNHLITGCPFCNMSYCD